MGFIADHTAIMQPLTEVLRAIPEAIRTDAPEAVAGGARETHDGDFLFASRLTASQAAVLHAPPA